jgi:hypothetical protein
MNAINSIDECVTAFELLAQEIVKIKEDIFGIIDSYLFSKILYESIDYKKHDELVITINKRKDKIDSLNVIISNFLNSGILYIENRTVHSNNTLDIQRCVDFINIFTKGLIVSIREYNKKSISNPSIENEVELYRKSIIIFNNNVHLWNETFHTQIQDAINL